MSDDQVRIVSFDPLQLELPAGDTVPAGEVKFVLPPVRIFIAKGLAPLPPATRFAVNADVSCSLLLAEELPVALLAEFVAAHLDVFRRAHINLTAKHGAIPERDFQQAHDLNVLTSVMNKSIGAPG